MKKQEGGKVIASGGFGCIFSPPLKCNDYMVKDSINDNNRVSKLMTVKHAEDEFNQIQKYNNILKVIPNYENYFLINNFELCHPSELKKEDLKGYKKKCKSLKKKGINIKNINKSLSKLMIINMPNGGIDIEKFVKEYWVTSNIIRLNNSLINLLINGIIPMNKLNVYHCDIKDGNVLVQINAKNNSDLENKPVLITRLIDWGLSIVWDKKQKGIPRKLYRRPFQFNVPFSSVFFNKDFLELYNSFLSLNNNPDYFQIREFVINYIFIWNDIRGPGHLSAINDIIRKLTIKDLTAIKKHKIKEHFVEYDFTYYYIIEYLSKILEKYTNNGELDIMSYFENIFLKNIDIWGFVMIYITLYEYLFESFDELNEYQMEFITKIKYIIIHFLYENPITPIDVTSLVNELTSLNKVIENFGVDDSSKRLEYYSEMENSIGGFKKNKRIKEMKTRKKSKKNKKQRTIKRR